MPPQITRSLTENHKRRRYVRGRAKRKLTTNNSQNGNHRKSFRATGKNLIPPKINQPQDVSANEPQNIDNSPNQFPPTGRPINGQHSNQRTSHGSNDILNRLRNGLSRKSEDMADKMSRLAAPKVPSSSPSTTTTTPTSTTPTTTTPTATSSASSAQSSPRPKASPQFRKTDAGKLGVPATPKNSPLLSQSSTPETCTPNSGRVTPKVSKSKQSGLGTIQPTGIGSVARTLQPDSGKPLESTPVKSVSKLSPTGSVQPEFAVVSRQRSPKISPQRSPSKLSGTSTPRVTDRGSRRNSPQLPRASSVKNSPKPSRRTSPRISPMMGAQWPSGSSSPKRLTSISSRTSPQMYNGGSSPSSLTAKHSSDDLRNGVSFRSLGGEILRPSDVHTSTSLTIKVNGSESPTGKNDLDPQDYNPKEPFDLVVAGICDANEKNYFPLQEKIMYLESKLLDVTLQLHRLQEEHRIVRVSHYHLDQTIKESQLVARDQVVFENLKLNFNLVSAELEEARKMIRELRQLGWENLPQRIVLECRRAYEQVEDLRRDRDMASHEHSAAKGIASEALKQVKVLKRSLEDHKKISDQLMMREHEAEEKYTQALKNVNQQWEEKLLQRHYRDKRRQQHLSYMLEEERELAEDRDPAELEDIAFRANLVFKYPTLVECVEDATHVRGRDLGAISDAESEKSWHVASKVSYKLSEHLIEDANRANIRGKRTGSFAPTKFGSLLRSVSKSAVDPGEGQSITMGDDTTSVKDNPPTDAERAAWEHVKMQMRRKLEEKDDEIRRLRNQIKPLEDDLADLKSRTFTEYQMEEQIKALDEENEILVEHYLSEMVLRKKYLNELQDLKGQIRVYCRIRPAPPAEESRKNPIVVYTPDQYTVLVKVSRGLKVFQYDRVYTSGATQNDVFGDVADLIHSVIDGYNVCIFAYGETGSGKSFTLTGDRDKPGLVPRVMGRLFEILENPLFRIRCYSDVSITLLDLYSNKFMDLLVDYAEHMDMDIKPDQNGIMQVQGTVKKHVGCAAEFHELYHKGLAVRHTAETRLGITGSKSHLILTVNVMTTNKMSKTTYYGKITFIQLAGSERNVKPGSNGEITKEFQAINDSLSALGDVITGLYLAQSDVPYGNSKLTTLMQDSLGGNAKTLMFVNVNETEAHIAETLNSLNYASRLKTVKNTPERISNVEQVTRLRMTTERLKKGETNAC